MSRKPQEINIPVIAREAGVSPSTVSRVINRRSGVGEATRKRITDILQNYGFTTNYPSMKTTKIAVIYPWTQLTEYFRKAMDGIYAYAMKNQLLINLSIACANRKESLLEAVREQQCAGVIALLAEHYYEDLEEFSETDLPVVLIDYATANQRFGFIDHDSYSGSCEAVRHLLNLGHHRIGYLTYEQMSLNQLQRYKGYENTLNAAGIPLNKNYIQQKSHCEPDTPQPSSASTTRPPEMAIQRVRGASGYHGTMKLLERAPELTAIMAVDDSMALGAMAAAHELGRKIPQDLSIIGFDNYAEGLYWQPALTTVNHPLEQAGYMAIDAVHSAIKDTSQWSAPREILPTSLVIRKSTAPASACRNLPDLI